MQEEADDRELGQVRSDTWVSHLLFALNIAAKKKWQRTKERIFYLLLLALTPTFVLSVISEVILRREMSEVIQHTMILSAVLLVVAAGVTAIMASSFRKYFALGEKDGSASVEEDADSKAIVTDFPLPARRRILVPLLLLVTYAILYGWVFVDGALPLYAHFLYLAFCFSSVIAVFRSLA